MLKRKDLLFVDFPQTREITEEVKRKNMGRFIPGSVRTNSGMYRTDKETREYIEKSLKRKLP